MSPRPAARQPDVEPVRVECAALPAALDRLRARLAAGELVLELRGPADLRAVDALARLALAARRSGCALRVRTGPPLAGLLALTGLAQALGVEVDGQPEADEDVVAEEVVQVGDAAVAQLEHLDRPGVQPAGRVGLVLGEAGLPVDLERLQP